MPPDEAVAIALEQYRAWVAAGWTAELAWQALTNNPARNNGSWPQVFNFMVAWLRQHDPQQLELRLVA